MSKEPFSLVGLLFGNLGDTLDKATQEQLSSWNPNGLFDFNSIGVTEGDENADKGKNSRRYDDGVIQKAPDAVDFEDEDEVAEDEQSASTPSAPQLDSAIANRYYAKALESITTTTTTATTTTPSSSHHQHHSHHHLDDENYDDAGEQPAQPTAPSVPTSAQHVKEVPDEDKQKIVPTSKKRKSRAPLLKDKTVSVIPQALQVLFASPDSIDPDETLDPAIRQVCSAVFTPNGPILKFSELFVYLQNYLSPTRHRRIKLQPQKAPVNTNNINMELDEEVVFDLGGLQLDREREEEEAEKEQGDDDDDDHNKMAMAVPDLSGLLPAAPSHQLIPSSLSTPSVKPLFRQSQELFANTQLSSGGVPLWDSGKQGPPSVISVHIPDVTYHPVVLDEWEDRIIWEPKDDEETESHPQQQRVPSISIEFDQVFNRPGTRWGVLLPPAQDTTVPRNTGDDYTHTNSLIATNQLHIDEVGDLLDTKPASLASSSYSVSSPATSPPTSTTPSPLIVSGSIPAFPTTLTTSQSLPIQYQPSPVQPQSAHSQITNSQSIHPPTLPQAIHSQPTQSHPAQPHSTPSHSTLSHSTRSQSTNPDLLWSLFPLINKEFEDGRWLHNVIWDDAKDVLKTDSRILDLNDKYMLIEGPCDAAVPTGMVGAGTGTGAGAFKTATGATLSSQQQDAVVPDGEVSDGAKKKPKPKPKPKVKAPVKTDNAEQTKEKEEEATTLRITPTHYGKEASARTETTLDIFNLSHDDYYSTGMGRNRVRHKTSKALVVHSTPASKLSLVPTHLTSVDLQHFHRPRGVFAPGSPYRVAVVTKDRHTNGKPKKALNRVDIMKHKSDLSAREGRVIFTEYMEERPPLLENVGMGTRICNFYRKKSPDDTPILSHEDGETILLDDQDDSPFLGDIEPGHSIQALVNNLFKAPIYKHEAAPTDFLLVKSKEGKKWYIREMGPVYTVGQEMPLMEVPAPNSRAANLFIKLRMQAYVYRAFMKKSNPQRRLRISDVYSAFPRQTDTAIRKRFQDCADFQRGGDDSGWWTLKESFTLPNEEELQKMVSPEAVCCFESMLRGQQYLADLGISTFTNVGSIPQAVSSLPDSDPLKQRAMLVENELQLTPWNLTFNFISAMQGKGRLQLTGIGDPSGRGEA
eukprot:Phypoly_transcript_00272.p1 GENE.Phypoly_transcript_00272~~Phypoly_transcript_00272.p1  ORF type:complete len:1142 (+),score=223.59 Phypoly_transcript_00272:41-3466(+)